MKYLEIHIKNPVDLTEILIAELSEAGYDSFMETDEGVIAYTDQSIFEESRLQEILSRYLEMPEYRIAPLEDKNWNEEWEKNFQPVEVDDQVIIKASFHKMGEHYPVQITINPKMSFGTGHHETTYMMVQNQLGIDHKGRRVMDAGTGTGILAILASKLGASDVFAFDIEDWAFENLKENVILNDCRNIKVGQGTIESLDSPFPFYDIILANINKNVLLNEIPRYAGFLPKNGILVLSGFYKEDVQDIEKAGHSASLTLLQERARNKWASLVFKKI